MKTRRRGQLSAFGLGGLSLSTILTLALGTCLAGGCAFIGETTDVQGFRISVGAPVTIEVETFARQERPGDPQTGKSEYRWEWPKWLTDVLSGTATAAIQPALEPDPVPDP